MAIIGALFGGMTQAEASDVVRLHESYLAEPASWCAADKGIPVIISVDGPELFVGVPIAEQPTSVRVRRGASEVQRIEVGTKDPTELLTRHGTDRTHSSTTTTSLNRAPESLTPVGRFDATARFCQSIWGRDRGTVNWRVVQPDGTIAVEGKDGLPHIDADAFFNAFRPYPKALRLGDNTFVVLEHPTFERTTEAFASPAKETQQ